MNTILDLQLGHDLEAVYFARTGDVAYALTVLLNRLENAPGEARWNLH